MMKKTKSTPHPQMPSRTLSSSASWILRGCKHPRTPSFSLDNKELETYATIDYDHARHRGGGDEATLSDVDRFLMENFKSLYRRHRNHERPASNVINKELNTSGNLLADSSESSEPPNNVRRIFHGSSSSSTSIIEESRISLTLTSGSATDDLGSCSVAAAAAGGGYSWKKIIEDAEEDVMGVAEDFITVLKFSPNPYVDFKKSMQEMVESRLDRNGKIDWEFMEELLFCYLKLNNKKSYKFILRAFVDLVVVLRGNSDRLPPKL